MSDVGVLSKKRHVQWLIAGGVLLVIVGAVLLPRARDHAAKTGPEATAQLAAPLPVAPADWHGTIDYKAFDARINSMMSDPSMEGLGVAVVEQGRLSFVKGYGVTASQHGEPVTPQTVFRWASLSKTIAGTLSARLAADGTFSLHDPLGIFDTSLRLPGEAQTSLTIEQLLSQRTGLGKNAYDGQLEDGQDPAKIRGSFGALKPVCPPGTCHSYQNIAYDTISEVIRERTGAPYADTVRRRIFQPLGMSGATIGMAGLTSAAHWARPHRHGNELKLSEAYYRVPAAAGVNSTIVDLAAWMQAQMGLRPDVLPPAVLDEVQRARVATGRPYGRLNIARELKSPGYGLGMRSFDYKGHHLIGHSGGVSGYRSTMMFDPATKTGIVMLWNSDANLPFRFQAEFFDRAFQLPFTDYLDLDSGAPAVTSAAEVSG
ncbi:serine hydrolase domain-containing protein [Caulobacter sp.]|uniref:serine hydrolase domain-containing protein n=1 Tax=Caulobacter sp. TaxID=78 RepID=UPI001B0D986F|nr:serine hydrolase domain-containing protein [Caulobacter sp.]MBO9546911.1 beta-lactamase family protein [Caulobacter sp.]